MSTGFAGQVAAWRLSVETMATTVLREAVRGIVEEAGAHAGPGEVADDIRRQLKAINPGRVRLGGVFLMQAEHDRGQALNYGFTVTDEWRRTHSQPGRNFIGLTTRRWPRIVRETAQRFKT